MDLITSILAITVRAGTSLIFATIGEILTERAGILNLGIEGISRPPRGRGGGRRDGGPARLPHRDHEG